MEKRRFRPRIREKKFRDAKLIIIATEGSKTEHAYFNSLAFDERYRNRKVHVEVLEKKTTASAPKDVIKYLNKFKQEYKLNRHDELWLVIDRDSWSEQMLSEVTQQARQNYYLLADSNPCFELWLLLHRKSLGNYNEEELKELEANKKAGYRTRLEKELMEICGSYNKNNLKTSHYIPYVSTAIKNAKETDTQPQDRWLNQIGTRVYRLAQSIIRPSPSAKRLDN